MRLSNEAVTSCKAMAMVVLLCGAIVLLAAAARCRDMLQLPLPCCTSEKASAFGGVHCSMYVRKDIAAEFMGY